MSYTIFILMFFVLGVFSQTAVVIPTGDRVSPNDRNLEIKFSYDDHQFSTTIYPQALSIRCGHPNANATLSTLSEDDLPPCTTKTNCFEGFHAQYVKFFFSPIVINNSTNMTMSTVVELRGEKFDVLNSSSAIIIGQSRGIAVEIEHGLLWCPHFPENDLKYLVSTQISHPDDGRRRDCGAFSFSHCPSATLEDLDTVIIDINVHMDEISSQFDSLIDQDRENALAYDKFTGYLVGVYENYTAYINEQLAQFANSTLINMEGLWNEVSNANNQTARWLDYDGQSIGSIRHEMFLNRFFEEALAFEKDNNILLYSPFNNSRTRISSVSRIEVGRRYITYSLAFEPTDGIWTRVDVVGKFDNNIVNGSLADESCSFSEYLSNGSHYFGRDVAGSPLTLMTTIETFEDTGFSLVTPPFSCYPNEVTSVTGSFDYYGVLVSVDFSNASYSVVPYSPTIMFFGSSVTAVDVVIGSPLDLDKYVYSKYVQPGQLNSALDRVEQTANVMQNQADVHSAQLASIQTSASAKCGASFIGICFTGAEHIVLFILFVVIVILGLLAGYHYYKKRESSKGLSAPFVPGKIKSPSVLDYEV